jgi:hypothetical protein
MWLSQTWPNRLVVNALPNGTLDLRNARELPAFYLVWIIT